MTLLEFFKPKSIVISSLMIEFSIHDTKIQKSFTKVTKQIDKSNEIILIVLWVNLLMLHHFGIVLSIDARVQLALQMEECT